MNAGAKLKGEWSRLDYMSRHDFQRNAVREVTAELPLGAHSLYYRDAIGNISTSAARFGSKGVSGRGSRVRKRACAGVGLWVKVWDDKRVGEERGPGGGGGRGGTKQGDAYLGRAQMRFVWGWGGHASPLLAQL